MQVIQAVSHGTVRTQPPYLHIGHAYDYHEYICPRPEGRGVLISHFLMKVSLVQMDEATSIKG